LVILLIILIAHWIAVLSDGEKKIALYYACLQAIIWLKCAVFFILFGRGKVMAFSAREFPAWVLLPDWIFHTGVHIFVAILALAFGARTQDPKKNGARLIAIIFAAVFLHNVGYWLTNAYPGVAYILRDFVVDSGLLLIAVLAGHYGGKLAWKMSKFLSPSNINEKN